MAGVKSCSTAEAIPFATTSWLPVLPAMDPSSGSVRKDGSITAPGIWLGVEKSPADAEPSKSRWSLPADAAARPPSAGSPTEEPSFASEERRQWGCPTPESSWPIEHRSARGWRTEGSPLKGRSESRSDTSGIIRASSGVHVDANEQVGTGHVCAHIPRRNVVMRSHKAEQLPVRVSWTELEDGRIFGSRDHHVNPSARKIATVSSSLARLIGGLFDLLARLGHAHAAGVETTVPGIEENSRVPIAAG